MALPDGARQARRTALDAGLRRGRHVSQAIHLDPGDAVAFDDARPPAWRWKALR